MNIFKKLFSKKETTELLLPIGKKEYDAWSKKIIQAANVPGLTEDSANFALTSMILHLPSTQAIKDTNFFIFALHKSAANQTAVAIMQEIEQRQTAKKAEEAQQKRASTLKLVTEVAPDAPKS